MSLSPLGERRRVRERDRREASERERRRAEWAAHNGLRISRADRTDPVPWLLGRRGPCYSGGPRWFDHGTRWTRDGKPYCLVGQPYGLHPADLRDLLALQEEHGLGVLVDAYPSWHLPGAVLSVIVKRGEG